MLQLGSDPELFLEDPTGKVISAIGKIGGRKDKPKKVTKLGSGFAIQEDNVLLEFNVPPAKYQETWVENHKKMLDYLTELVRKMGLVLSTKASHSMDDDQLKHPKAFVFGCEPDFDVWNLEWNKKPACDDPNLRSAGGHIHVAYDKPTSETSIKLARLLDLTVGAPLALVDPDKRRAQLYGRPGAIRFKTYGLEYRTPSNYWLLNEKNVGAVFANVSMTQRYILPHYESFAPLAEECRQFLAGKGDCPDLSILKDFESVQCV
jgi:hypothetical protein